MLKHFRVLAKNYHQNAPSLNLSFWDFLILSAQKQVSISLAESSLAAGDDLHGTVLGEVLHLRLAREVGRDLAHRLRVDSSSRTRPFCLIAGGETTVTIKGNGKGGRNQELTLAAVDELAGLKDVILISLATDGDDGPTDAAGAVVTGESIYAWASDHEESHLPIRHAVITYDRVPSRPDDAAQGIDARYHRRH